MAIASRQVSVGPNKVLLADYGVSTSGGANVVLLNSDAVFTVFIGGADVTTSNGLALKPGASFSTTLVNPEALYAIAGGTTSTATVFVFRGGA